MELVSDAVDIQSQKTQSLAVSSTAAVVQAQESGVFDLWCATEVAISIGPSSVATVTATTGYLLRANNTVPFKVTKGNYIQAITASASDTLYFQKTGNL
jgi:hypothetical protein